jgi:uncharacterized membrane protein
MRKWYPLVLIAVSVIASVIVYAKLPDRIPTHWNANGQVNGYGSKWLTVGLFPLILLAMWGMLRFLPTIDPRRENYAKFQSTYDLVVNSALTVVALVHGAAIASALGVPISFIRLMPIVVGAMFVILGNAMPRARPNWWFGFRTPWTLSNDRVWERTHRVGGYLLVAAGIVTALVTLIDENVAFVALVILGATTSLATVIYSYVAWRQETSR